jgi:hypothetical protein
MTTWVAQAGVTFRSVDWFVPPYMQGGVLRRVAAAIEAAPTAQRHSVLEGALKELYGPEYMAVMLLERYQKVDPVSEFSKQIRDAIEASAFGLDYAAVATLLPVLEGVIRRLANADGRDVGRGTSKLADEIDQLAVHERKAFGQSGADEAILERIEMIEQLRDFMRDRLLVKTADYAGINKLNRHGIVHGVFDDYDVESNFQKLVSFLDGLVFFVSLRRSGISCLAPGDTTESLRLASYLRDLSVARRARPKL